MSKSIEISHVSKMYYLGEAYSDNIRDVLARCLNPKKIFKHQDRPKLWALKDISFDVNEGEVFGIIGKNGSGKSTLLKVLSKITHPTNGSYSLNGNVSSLLEVGTGFHEELTGRENIFLNGSILGMKKQEILKQFDAIVDFSGISKFIDTPLKRYSSGMRLRLGFAVSAHLYADILLIDEILAVGDLEFQKKCLSKMGDMQNSGKTVVLVSHNLASIEQHCDRVAWINSGDLVTVSDAGEVVSEYIKSYSNSTGLDVDLTKTLDRRGDGKIQFTRFQVLDKNDVPMGNVRAGDKLRCRLHYKASSNISNAHFHIELHNSNGVRMTTITTKATGKQINDINKGEGHIDLIVDNFNLMPDRYYITIATHSNETRHDRLDNVVAIDVLESDFFKTGSGVSKEYGVILLPHIWCKPVGMQNSLQQ